ncbi:hypothetical protein Tco_0622343 [Tanacetum coccineum]
MEILLVSSSNSTAIDTSKYNESNASTSEDLTLREGNSVKEVLIMNLPDHKYNIYTIKGLDDGVITSF